MPTLDSTITGFVVGNDIRIDRTITNIPPDDSVSKAYFTVKRYDTQIDGDAVFQKTISTGYVQHQGQITNTGASGTATLFFEIPASDTNKLQHDVDYVFDIQLETANGATYTPESGTMTGTHRITQATS